jgi:nucleoside-diphosphate-sugar epimerase
MRVFMALAQGEQVTLVDDGLATLQHVHAEDVAQAFSCALAHREAAVGETFHVAAAEPVTMRAYAEAAAGWFGREADLAYLPWEEWRATAAARDAVLTRDHTLHSPCASIEKARRLLGFEPRYGAVAAAQEAVTAILGGAASMHES